MKTLNLNLALIAIQVLSIDEETGLADINFAYAEPREDGKAKQWHRLDMENIFITGRAKKKLLDPEEKDYVIGKAYVSLNKSKDAKQNPFCLMRKHIVDEKGESQVTYYLKCVEENGSYLETKTMPNGDEAVRRVWIKDKPDYAFVRYIDMYDKQKAYHDKEVAQSQSA